MNGSARTIVCISSLVLAAGTASARPASPLHQLAPTETDVDVIGDAAGTHPVAQKILADTVWIADWTFDTLGPCDDTGWVMTAGWNRSVAWNGLDDAGRKVPTGVYLYRLDAGGIPLTKKMVLMK